MAFEDALFSHIIWKVFFPSCLIWSTFLLLLSHSEKLKYKFNYWVIPHFCPHDLQLPEGLKWKVFGHRLQSLKSFDWQLKNRGLIRILEIGVGEGKNFDFYPKNSRLVLLEPNPYMKKALLQNFADYPHLKLEQYLEDKVEDMTTVSDSSIDAVVTTGVLCSVCDVQAALDEILRVLAPGGEYLYVEHSNASGNFLKQAFLYLLSPFWWTLLNCDLRRDVLSGIHAAKFKESAHYTCANDSCDGMITELLFNSVVVGYAVK